MKNTDLHIGDRVRIVRCWFHNLEHEGATGVITRFHYDGDYRVRCESKENYHNECDAVEVEKLPTRGRPKGSRNKLKAEPIKVPRCIRTVTGRHYFQKLDADWSMVCRYCGLFDDREESK